MGGSEESEKGEVNTPARKVWIWSVEEYAFQAGVFLSFELIDNCSQLQ